MLNAEFLWAVQVMVYAGAILVLYLFVLMLLNLKTDERYFHSTKLRTCSYRPCSVRVYVLVLMVSSPLSGAKGDVPAAAILQQGDTYAVGIKMFSEYLSAVRNRRDLPDLGAIIGRHRAGENTEADGGQANGDL